MPDIKDMDAAYLNGLAENLRSRWTARNNLMEECQLLYQMDTSDRKRGYEIIKDNIAHRAVTLSVALLTQGSLRVRAPVVAGQEEGSVGEKVERILRGLLRLCDRKAMRRLNYPTRYALAAFEAIRGWWALLPLVTVDGDGTTSFDLRVLDPINVYPEMGPDGPSYTIHNYWTTSAAAHEMWETHKVHDRSDDLVQVIDYYDKEYNAASADGEMVKPPLPHECGFIPLLTGPVGGSPVRSVWNDAVSYIEYMGLPVLFNVKELIRQQNKVLTLIYAHMEQFVYGPIFVRSTDGRVIKLDMRTGRMNYIKEDVKIEGLPDKGPTPDMMALLGTFTGMIERGTFPNMPPGESGFARSILQNTVRTTLGPARFSTEFALEEAIHTWISWFYNKGVHPVTIKGFGRDQASFEEEWNPLDIDPDIEIQVGINMKMPQDLLQMGQLAAILKQAGIPLSDYHIMDEFLDVEDVAGEFSRSIRERAMMHPRVLLMKMAEEYEKIGSTEIAQLLRQEAGAMGQATAGAAGLGPVPEQLPPPQPGGPEMKEPGTREPLTLPSPVQVEAALPTSTLPLQMQGVPPEAYERLRRAGLEYARR